MLGMWVVSMMLAWVWGIGTVMEWCCFLEHYVRRIAVGRCEWLACALLGLMGVGDVLCYYFCFGSLVTSLFRIIVYILKFVGVDSFRPPRRNAQK